MVQREGVIQNERDGKRYFPLPAKVLLTIKKRGATLF
jgi:hypothetical protein